MSKVVLRALDLIGDHLRTHKAGGGADAPLDLAKQIVQQRMDNPAPAAPPVAEAAPKNTTQGSVFASKPRVVAPSGLYSHAAEVAGQLQQNKGSAEQMIGMMTNAGVKPAELEHAGMITPEGNVHPDWAGRTVTRDELHKHLTDSMPKVEEKVKGANNLPGEKSHKYGLELEKKYNLEPYSIFNHMDLLTDEEKNKLSDLSGEYLKAHQSKEPTKYEKWLLPGGENYREVLLQSPESSEYVVRNKRDEILSRHPNRESALEAMKQHKENDPFVNIDKASDIEGYNSDHWHEPNVLAHLRMSDRTGPNGEKLLHVEEMQSDWGQEGREYGFKNPELESRKAKLIGSIADAMHRREEEFKRIHRQHAIDMGPYDKAYKNAMAEADEKFFSSKQGYSDQAEYNQVGEKVEEELAHLRKEADAKRHAAFNQYQYGTLYNEPINKLKDELKKLPKSGNTPLGPYVTSTQGWTDLALKRVMKEAAEGGYHGIVFTPGAEQVKRYDLSQQIDELAHWRMGDKIGLSASGPEGAVLDQHYVSKEKLPSVVGKELAEKILNGEGSSKSVTGYPEEEGVNFISGKDLSVGGEGMKSYYDKMVPSYLQKLAKQHDKDAKLGTLRTNSLPDMLHLPVTDKMRESVLKGQKAFADGGEVEGYRKGSTTQGSVFSTNHIIGPPEMQGPKMPEFEGEDHPNWIPQRLPVYKAGRKPDPNARLKVDMDALRSTPALYNKQADAIKKYVNFPEHLQGASNDEAMEYFINHVKENLLALHDHVAPKVRQRSKLWYDGARKITDDWAQKYNLPDHSVAGALAALSPQTDWFANVSRAERVLDAMKGNGQMAVKPHGLDDFYNQFKFSPEMDQRFKSVDKKGVAYSLNKPDYAPIYDMLKGKSLGDLDQLDLPAKEKAVAKAMWIRLYDESHNSSAHKLVTPEGNFGDLVKNDNGTHAGAGWGSLVEIAKAIRSVEEANNPKEISNLMGVKHKVRNFYNNILSPNSKHGDVTMDTHAIAAGLLRPLSGSSLEVAHNLDSSPGKGMPSAGGSDATGIRGTYPIFAEAYRRAAKERDLLPREMQSITWEAVRSLFPRTWKRAKNVSAVDDIWNQYRNGHIGRNEARSKIFELTGATHGIQPPSWFGQSAGQSHASAESSGNQGNVSGSGAHGASTAPIVSGTRGRGPQGGPSAPQGPQEELARGGTAKAHPASIIPGVHIVGHNPIFHGDE